MQRAYLILFIENKTRQVVRAQVASAYPVSQAELGKVSQVCAIQITADNFERAKTSVMQHVAPPAWSWLRPLLA